MKFAVLAQMSFAAEILVGLESVVVSIRATPSSVRIAFIPSGIGDVMP